MNTYEIYTKKGNELITYSISGIHRYEVYVDSLNEWIQIDFSKLEKSYSFIKLKERLERLAFDQDWNEAKYDNYTIDNFVE